VLATLLRWSLTITKRQSPTQALLSIIEMRHKMW